MQISNRILELEKLIDYHDKKFWEDNNPEISDFQYHEYVKELSNLDPGNPKINQRRASLPPSSKRNKVKHSKPLLSLDKVYNIPDLLKWCTSVSRNENELFRIEPKLDGISANYENRILSTRGDDGLVGDDITDKSQIIMLDCTDGEIPLIRNQRNIRGEIVMKKSTFQNNIANLVRKDGKPYKYPRSACVGLLLQDNIDVSLGTVLTFVEYLRFSFMQPLHIMRSMEWEYFISEVQEWDYPTDGIVVKLADDQYSESLGYTAKFPRGQMALKYGNPIGESIITDVVWSVGKGKITPVCIIDPIILAGAKISKLTLHNAKFIIDRDIKINDVIILERAGEIIPHVVEVKPSEIRKDVIITECPECGGEISYIEPELYCMNKNCSGKLIKNLTDSVKRLKIENLGEPTIGKLIDIGIETIVDIFNITLQELESLSGFAELSAMNLYNEIQKVKNSEIEDWRFLSSFNIPNIGRTISKKILSEVTLYELFEMSIDDMQQINGIGDERSYDLYEYLHSEIEIISELYSILNIKDSKNLKIKNQNICFTGKYELSRDKLSELAEANGYSVVGNVTQELNLLVTDDMNGRSSKITKAKSLNCKIITYNEFMKILERED